MAFESTEERIAFASVWQETARVGNVDVPGLFEEPQVEDLLIEGTAPTFMSSRELLTDAGITIGITIDSITTLTGDTRGPFRVVRWQVESDGAFVTLALQQT